MSAVFHTHSPSRMAGGASSATRRSSSCGLSSKGQSGEATFTNGTEKHSYGEPNITESTCITRGEKEYTCTLCGDGYVTYMDALSGYTWDFSTNSTTSTNGSSKLSLTSYATGNTLGVGSDPARAGTTLQ